MIKDIKVRFPELIRLVSYQDTEAHLGTIYKASNWTAAPTQTSLLDWTTSKRKRSSLQSTADKVRWEYNL